MWRSTEAIRGVGFDLWETLITNSHEASRRQEIARVTRLAAKLRELGVSVSDEHLGAAHREVWQRCHELYWSRDVDIPTMQQIMHFIEILECEVGDDQLAQLEEIYATALLDHPPELVEGARETLETLKARGLRTGLISNTGRTPGTTLRRLLDDLGIGELLDALVFSNEQRVCKPQRSIFEALAAELELPPQAIAFVGDNREADVYGAVQSGMYAIHFARESKGTAFAPESGRGEECAPHATVKTLRELPEVLRRVGNRSGTATSIAASTPQG